LASEYWARLEDRDGHVVGTDPAWKPQRQFLWDVVHDTRGILRDDSLYDDLELIRKIDGAAGTGGPSYSLDAQRVRRIFETIYSRAKASDARFRLVATDGKDDWAAVKFFEDAGAEYAVVGGWTGPFLRTISPEPDQASIPEGRLTVGRHRFIVKAVPYADYFREDLESLLALLMDAERRGLRVRFLQR
jgi:hypothetical protein